MVVRKKNLLDAFREAAPEGRRSAELPQRSPTPVGGPFASIPPPAPPRAPEKPPEVDFEMPEMPSLYQQALGDRTLRLVVGAAALVALAAFLYGRFVDGSAEAAAPETEVVSGPGRIERGKGAAPSAGANLAQQNRAAARMGSEDDKAFMDPANKYTIRLIQYDANDQNLERAHATAEHLRRKEGLPVVGPISMGSVLVLAAGHAPKIADLDALLAHVRTLPGPPPQEKSKPFKTAYVVNIDDVVKRD